jgi:hypothetical protein
MANARRLTPGRRAVWTVAILIGLVVRLVLVPYKGTADMDSYLAWGRDVATYGLGDTYHGIYFPLQYQLFRLAVGAASVLGISEVAALKLGNLARDAGAFVLLVLILRRLRLPPAYALVYWLHPYFLAIFWLGYIDMQSGLLLLAALLALSYTTKPLHYVAAGIPLGLMFLMKPQGIAFIFMIGLAAVVGIVGRRRIGFAKPGAAFARRAAPRCCWWRLRSFSYAIRWRSQHTGTRSATSPTRTHPANWRDRARVSTPI